MDDILDYPQVLTYKPNGLKRIEIFLNNTQEQLRSNINAPIGIDNLLAAVEQLTDGSQEQIEEAKETIILGFVENEDLAIEMIMSGMPLSDNEIRHRLRGKSWNTISMFLLLRDMFKLAREEQIDSKSDVQAGVGEDLQPEVDTDVQAGLATDRDKWPGDRERFHAHRRRKVT